LQTFATKRTFPSLTVVLIPISTHPNVQTVAIVVKLGWVTAITVGRVTEKRRVSVVYSVYTLGSVVKRGTYRTVGRKAKIGGDETCIHHIGRVAEESRMS
jgi:hypothetical protein